MAIKTFLDGGINWNWYLQADINEEEKTATILFYDRWHKYEGDKHPKVTEKRFPRVQFIEDDHRTVLAIRLDQIEYKVTNPAYVFKYNNKTHLELEE